LMAANAAMLTAILRSWFFMRFTIFSLHTSAVGVIFPVFRAFIIRAVKFYFKRDRRSLHEKELLHASTARSGWRRAANEKTRRQAAPARRVHAHSQQLQRHERACHGHHTRPVPQLGNKHTGRREQLVWLRGHFCDEGSVQPVFVVGLLPAFVCCCPRMVCLLAAVSARCIIQQLHIKDNAI
jgi:hypothetical protein